MASRHSLLDRQLKQHGIVADALSEALQKLLAAVSEAYDQADADRRMVERSLELMSQELLQRNVELKQDILRRKQIEQALEAKLKELQLLNHVMMGREDRILELKTEVKTLQYRAATEGRHE